MVLAHRVHVAEVEVGGQPGRLIVADPQRDRRMVAQHRDHLGLLLARRGLEEAGLVVTAVVHVCADQRQVLEDEHAGRIGLPVEVGGQHVGDDPQRVEVRLLGDCDVRRERLGRQLIEPVRGRIASAA